MREQTHNRHSKSSVLVAVGLLIASVVMGGAALRSPLRAQPAQPSTIGIPVRFTDVRQAAGITFQHDATMSEEKNYIETMGNGLGWIDYDQDGLMDLYPGTDGSRGVVQTLAALALGSISQQRRWNVYGCHGKGRRRRRGTLRPRRGRG